MKIKTSSIWGYRTMAFVAWSRRFRLGSWRHQQEMTHIHNWQKGIREWQSLGNEFGSLAADAGRLIKGYGRVRELALADLSLFLEQGLVLLPQIQSAGGDAAAAGQKALTAITSEAGKGQVGIDLLQAELKTLETAAA